MNSLNYDELTARYALLCRSTQSDLVGSPQGLQLVPHLSTLRTLLKHDLRSLGRQGSPDDFADIYFELERELERFHEFCSFSKLSQKFVVAFGGGFSAGKSSLINTLLGKRLLVTEVDPTTSLPTYLLHAEEDAVHAHNLFGHRIGLSEEEFLSLTHDEVPRFGSNISRLLRSAFITRRDFPWQNLALIDTPGYTKHDDRQHSVRTDEQIARAQLNSAQAIVWVIDARQGCITEDDLRFLASLNPDIPRLIAVSRADQRPAEDIGKIVAGIRSALETRNLSVLDVVAVSARKKEWSPTLILEQLTHWNKSSRELRFAHNFKLQFTRYARFLENELRQAQQHLNRLNRILALTEEEAIQQDAEELKLKANSVLKINVQLSSELASLRHRFFAELKAIGDHVGIPLPEPSELDLLDEQRFDLLKLLVQQREAGGVAAPDESATLRELMQPGDTPKIVAFLNGETKQTMGAHFAAKLDSHCRETYARFLAAIICHEGPVLSEVQSVLFLKTLETLGLKDIRTALFAQAQKMTGEDFAECKRIVAEHGLANNLFFDTLMLSRCNGPLNENHIQLFAELGSTLNLDTKTVTGMAVLSGYVLGVHARSEYASKNVLELIHWHSLFFREMKKIDTKNGIITGYLKSNKRIRLSYDDIHAKHLVLMASDDVVFVSDNSIKVECSTIVSHGDVCTEGARLLLIEDSEIQSFGKSKNIIFRGGVVGWVRSGWIYLTQKFYPMAMHIAI
jgi:GTP-binding protein EngB required for normal cell division